MMSLAPLFFRKVTSELVFELLMDGANASTIFDNTVGNDPVAMGDVIISTSDSMFGGSSGYFSGGVNES